MGRLEKKIVIVTGGAKGIGRGIALSFAKEGADVTIADINIALAENTAEEIRVLGQQAIVVKTDVRKENEVEEMVRKTLDKFGKIDVLVNNAGTIAPSHIDDVHARALEWEESEWDLTLDTNLKGTYLCCKFVIPHMKKQRRGKIVNISSSAGRRRRRSGTLAHYAASKAAVVSYTESIAAVLGEYNITANAICPYFIWTDLWKAGVGGEQNKERFDKIVQASLLKRATTPENIGALAVFLASEDADDITAQVIDIG
jgi:NAD(P)-dependent dehydrogenase (short-subunit alcohol dehydrogenase family)